MSDRIDPATGDAIEAPDYRYALRGIAFRLLAEGETEALRALWSALRDDASRHFTAAHSATSPELRRYWFTRRRDVLDLFYEVDDAMRCYDAQERRREARA